MPIPAPTSLPANYETAGWYLAQQLMGSPHVMPKLVRRTVIREQAQPFALFCGREDRMKNLAAPIADLTISDRASAGNVRESIEPIYGGYANPRGEIMLFAKDAAYCVNVAKQTLKERPQLNAGAQVRYDAAGLGEPFEYGTRTFRRLSNEQIVEICTSGRFRLTSKY